jgi:hypothetical protein
VRGYKGVNIGVIRGSNKKKLTSGTSAMSGFKPATFGVRHWPNVHQQSGSVAE